MRDNRGTAYQEPGGRRLLHNGQRAQILRDQGDCIVIVHGVWILGSGSLQYEGSGTDILRNNEACITRIQGALINDQGVTNNMNQGSHTMRD